jgi:hypothetical protein
MDTTLTYGVFSLPARSDSIIVLKTRDETAIAEEINRA